MHTQGHNVRDILHEYTTLQLKLWFPLLVNQWLVFGQHFILRLVRIDRLAAQQDALE